MGHFGASSQPYGIIFSVEKAENFREIATLLHQSAPLLSSFATS